MSRLGGFSRRFGGARRHKETFNRLITPAVALGTALQQITAEDIQTAVNQNVWQTYDTTNKIKYVVHSAVGRVTGVNVFSELGTVKQTINPAGVLNKWTGIGLGGILFTMIPKVPYKRQIRAASMGSLIGGIVGGLFDPPQASIERGASRQVGGVRTASMTPVQTNVNWSNRSI